jgi:RHS repeat-associated protein
MAMTPPVHTYCVVLNGQYACYDTLEEAEEVNRSTGSPAYQHLEYQQSHYNSSEPNRIALFYSVPRMEPEVTGPILYSTALWPFSFPDRLSEAEIRAEFESHGPERFPGCDFQVIGFSGGYPTPFGSFHSLPGQPTEGRISWIESPDRYIDFQVTCGGKTDTHQHTIQRHQAFTCPVDFRPILTSDALAAGAIHYHEGKWCKPDTNLVPGKFIYAYLTQVESCAANENPCYPTTGDKARVEPDFEFAGRQFTRYYHSLRQSGVGGSLGPGWTHTFSDRIDFESASKLALFRENGLVETFSDPSATHNYVSNMDRRTSIKLVAGSGFVLTDSLGTRKTFTTQGRLVRIEEPSRAIRIDLDYGPLGLTAATDQLGRRLEFAYSTKRLTGIVLPSGESVQYAYWPEGNLRSASYANGNVRTYKYDEPSLTSSGSSNKLTGILDDNVRYASFGYDARGRVQSSQLHGNEGTVAETSLLYVNDHQVVVTTPAGGVRTYDISSTQPFRRISQLSQGTETTTFGYSNGRLTLRTKNGVSTRYSYVSGYLKSITELDGTPSERKTEYTRNASFLLESRLVAEKVEGVFLTRQVDGWTYNPRGQLQTRTQTDPANSAMRTTTYSYCEAPDVGAKDSTCPILGLLKSVDGPRTDVSDVTSYTYYPSDGEFCSSGPTTCPHRKGDLWKVTNALGHVTENLAYDGAGRVMSSKGPNGVVTDFTYHPRGWLTHRKVRGPNNAAETDDAITTIDYYPTGLVERVTQPDGAFLAYEYDTAHRLEAIEDALGNRIEYTLDNAGNRTAEVTKDASEAIRRQLSRTYDMLGRPDLEKNAAGVTIANHGYDANGNPTSTEDALGYETHQAYDPLDRLERTIQDFGGLGVTTEFEYDALDRLTKVIDPKTLATNYEYNGFGDLTELDSPDTGVTGYTYDSAGNRQTQSDARGIPATYTYDELNRLTAITYPTASQNVAYFYDQKNGVTGCASSFFVGRLTRFTDATGSTTYCYDRRGNVTRKTQVTGALTLSTEYAYSLGDRLTEVTYPSGNRVSYAHDSNGAINSVEQTLVSLPPEPIVTGVDRLPFGPISRVKFANASELTLTYDANYVIDEIGGSALQLNLNTDLRGNIVGLMGTAPAQVRTFTYDPLSRLERVDNVSGSLIQAFTYDETGNRLSKEVQAGLITYGYPSTSHRLTSVGSATRTYDAIGSLTDRGDGLTLEYDDRQRLAAARIGGVLQQVYGYSARGERVVKSDGAGIGVGTSVYFTYDETGKLLAEYQGVGSATPVLQKEYIWVDDRPVAVFTNTGSYAGETLLIHSDHLGTPRAIRSQKNSMPTVWRWDLEGTVFGEHAPLQDPDGDSESFVFNLRYPGQYFDQESGLHYNYFRDYEASTGRYVESDPIGLLGGLSTFSYSLSRPLNFSDRQGLAVWFCGRASQMPPIGNHSYLWDDRTGRSCGMAQGGDPFQQEGGPTVDSCIRIEDSDGKEDKVFECCKNTVNDGIWMPPVNDCHEGADDCLKSQGLNNPGAPGGRMGTCDSCWIRRSCSPTPGGACVWLPGG